MNKDEFSSVHFYLFDDVYFLRWNMRAFTLICILVFVQIQMAIRTKSHRGDFVSLKTHKSPRWDLGHLNDMRAFTLICIFKFDEQKKIVQIQIAIRTKSRRWDFV